MKKVFPVLSIILIVSSLFLLSSCTPEDNYSKPVLGSTEIGIITEATANCTSMITSDGGYNITERGVCWSTTQNPTIEDNKTSDAYGTGEYTSTITNLSPSTTYYVRAYATNKVGTAYGIQATFTTNSCILTTYVTSSIMAKSAILGGVVLSNGDSLSITERGICWSTSINPTVDLETKSVDSSKADSFLCTMTNLLSNTVYYARIYATNSGGAIYGNEISFKTQNGVVNLTTTAATSIKTTSAIIGGNITDDGGASVTERGICWSLSPNPTITLSTKSIAASGLGSFTCSLSGLESGTTYFARSYATNSVGTSYGNEIIFTTIASRGTVTDIDGNIYHYVTIGTQAWMVENLKVTKYRDGTSISNVTDATQWSGLTTGAYCDYNNSASNSTTKGCLYNWYAVSNSLNIAPTGWHVPTDAEWTTLTTYLGGESVAGGKLKETGTTQWTSPNTAATNESGFSALPGGYRKSTNGTFNSIGNFGFWWSASELMTTGASYRRMDYSGGSVGKGASSRTAGYSVRCLRDL